LAKPARHRRTVDADQLPLFVDPVQEIAKTVSEPGPVNADAGAGVGAEVEGAVGEVTALTN
jgi:hypothetical protein